MMRILPEIKESRGEKVFVNGELERRMLLMCYYVVFGKPLSEVKTDFGDSVRTETIEMALFSIFKEDSIFAEFMSLMKFQYEQIDFVAERIHELGDAYPIELHCAYSRELILVALGRSNEQRKYPSREGTLPITEDNLDVFFVTLNKTEKEYSPTTMYQDYIINEELFHWQSQSTTSVESKTGIRYINQRKTNGKVLLFLRENASDDYVTMPFTCLGLVEYEEHSGSLPISIKYRLKRAMPGKLLENSMIV